jgi:hypothetical protein
VVVSSAKLNGDSWVVSRSMRLEMARLTNSDYYWVDVMKADDEKEPCGETAVEWTDTEPETQVASAMVLAFHVPGMSSYAAGTGVSAMFAVAYSWST